MARNPWVGPFPGYERRRICDVGEEQAGEEDAKHDCAIRRRHVRREHIIYRKST